MSTLQGTLRRGLLAVGLGATLLLAACGGEEDPFEADATTDGGGTSASAEAKGDIVVGGANFTEMQVMQQMYAQLLENAGWTVELQTAEQREVYAPALASGDIDVVPEYAATMAEYLNREANGPDAEPIATNDAAETVTAMQPLAEDKGLVVLDPAKAVDSNGFAVTQEFSESNSVTTMTQLGALGRPLVLAAVEECPERPFCQPGLESTYNIQISEIKPLGFSSPQTKEAVKDGDADFGLVGTTDGTLESFGLVLLEDDKGLQLADNLVPVANKATADADPALADTLNALAEVLTTEDLAGLNAQVDQDREKPEDVAKAYLEEKGLLG